MKDAGHAKPTRPLTLEEWLAEVLAGPQPRTAVGSDQIIRALHEAREERAEHLASLFRRPAHLPIDDPKP